MKEFPKMVYRREGDKIANRIVAEAAELAEATKEGWGDYGVALKPSQDVADDDAGRPLDDSAAEAKPRGRKVK